MNGSVLCEGPPGTLLREERPPVFEETGTQEAWMTCLGSKVSKWCSLDSTQLCMAPNLIFHYIILCNPGDTGGSMMLFSNSSNKRKQNKQTNPPFLHQDS